MTDAIKLNKNLVLIADDEKEICNLFVKVSSANLPGCKIDMAVNGLEAVHAFEDGHHAVIVMDLHMPVMDGFAAFRKIQSLCAENHIEMPSVIFFTGYMPSKELQDMVEKTPQHCILKKPVGIKKVVEEIKARLQI